jgi:hypothetical protein
MLVSVAGRSTVVGTTLRAIASVFAIAAKGFRLREVQLFNTTTTALAVALARFTVATNVGAGLTEAPWDPTIDGVQQITAFAGHTGDGTVGAVLLQATLGAAAGAGVIWTFGGVGIVVPVGTANGIGVICPTGTGQILDYVYTWEE